MTEEIEQLLQLRTATWDGDLLSKAARTYLVNLGYAKQAYGWNILTPAGVKLLVDMRLMKPRSSARKA